MTCDWPESLLFRHRFVIKRSRRGARNVQRNKAGERPHSEADRRGAMLRTYIEIGDWSNPSASALTGKNRVPQPYTDSHSSAAVPCHRVSGQEQIPDRQHSPRPRIQHVPRCVDNRHDPKHPTVARSQKRRVPLIIIPYPTGPPTQARDCTIAKDSVWRRGKPNVLASPAKVTPLIPRSPPSPR